MPFKIVQTIEEGVATLSVVPALWEAQGRLRWPPRTTKYPIQLVKHENSRPGPGWDTLKCTLKRNNIRTYEDANSELTLMEQNMDTDNEENDCMNFLVTSKTCRAKRNKSKENLTNSQDTVQKEEHQATVQIINSESSDTVLANQSLILNKLNLIIDNQKRFAQELASLSVQLDETNETIRQMQQEQQCNVTLLQDASSDERESFTLKAIETKEEFEMFEHTLTDKMYRKKIIKYLSPLYSSKPGQGQTCAYKLIDVFFSKEFLCHCSWSGGSRGEHSKIPMKNFINFRKFFFEIILMWDPFFTDDQMLIFFKTILKNANKRASMQGLRTSTKRVRRSKKLRDQLDNEAIVPDGSTDGNINQLEVNNSIITEEPRTGDNNA